MHEDKLCALRNNAHLHYQLAVNISIFKGVGRDDGLGQVSDSLLRLKVNLRFERQYSAFCGSWKLSHSNP